MKAPTQTWLPVREALNLLKSHGIIVKMPHLRWAGLKYDFARKMDDGFHHEYHRFRMLDYFKGNVAQPEPGEVKVSEVTKEAGWASSMTYYILDKYDIPMRKIGRGVGVNHVNKDQALRAIEQYRKDRHGKEKN